jgi:three-Cys-motif partner protein
VTAATGAFDMAQLGEPDPEQYRPGPDDLPARIVGGWVDRKTHFVDRYVRLFATGMSGKWKRRAYVELFAGPGLSWDRDHERFVEGSALRAARADFTHFCFVDSDPWAAVALRERLRRELPGLRPTVVIGDCNDAASFIRQNIPSSALTLVFVDPTNWQIRFDALAELVRDRRIDLVVTFQYGAMRRVRGIDVPALDAFFGTGEWRLILDGPRERRLEELLDLYNRQLSSLGFLPDARRNAVVVRNSRNVVLYALLLFTHHPRGYDFWRKATEIDESGQRGFWDPDGRPSDRRRIAVPDPAVKFTAPGLRVPAAPLLEEEGGPDRQRTVAELTGPRRVDRSGATPGLAPDDDPVNVGEVK